MTAEPETPELTNEYVYGALAVHRAVLKSLLLALDKFTGERDLILKELSSGLAKADASGDYRAGAERELKLLRVRPDAEKDGS